MNFQLKVVSISRKESFEPDPLSTPVTVELEAKRMVSGVGDDGKSWSFDITAQHATIYLDFDKASEVSLGDTWTLSSDGER